MTTWARWAIVVALVVPLGCSPGGRDPHARVLLIGIDAATPEVVERLAAQGLLPNLSALMDRGAWGVLESLVPMRSPALWTSIATGHPPAVHGIHSFQQHLPGNPVELVLVNATMRRVPALWKIAGRFQRTVGVVGWWVSWPAEEVQGFIVSDHVAHTRYHARRATGFGVHDRDTYPRDLWYEVSPLVRQPDEIDPSEVEAIAQLRKVELLALQSGTVGKKRPFRTLAYAWQQDGTYRDIALHLLGRRRQPDLFTVFFRGIDSIGHLFWHTFEPEKATGARTSGQPRTQAFEPEAAPGVPSVGRLFWKGKGSRPSKVPPEIVERLGGIVPGYYARIDRFVGEIVDALDTETDILIVSDHGMQASGASDPKGNPRPGEHSLNGFFLAAGPHIRPLGKTSSRSLLGVTPTVLRLLNVPVGEDMPVPPFEDLLELPWPPVRIPTHGTPADLEAIVPGSDLDETILEELRALGYIE
jgi:hypothetical protein